jgi:TRAP-type C4-dicarboxylate transport system permease small subunit
MSSAKWYDRVLDFFVGGLLLAIVALTLLQVGARYIFGGAFTWSEEANLFLWGWMILLAAVRSEHMRVDFLVKLLPRTAQKVTAAFLGAMSLFLLGVLFWGGIQMVNLTSSDYYTALSWLSVKWLFVGLMIGTVLWAITIARDTVQVLRTPDQEG